MNELIFSKIAAGVILFLSALLFGLLPLRARRWILKSKSISEVTAKAILSASICFGAGILLATTFLHILGEVRIKFDKLESDGILKDTEYPLSELVICCGFFLIYALEEVVHYTVDRLNRSRNDRGNRAKAFNKTEEYNIVPSKWTSDQDSSELSSKNGHVIVPLKLQSDSSDSSESELDPNQPGDSAHYQEVHSLRSVMTILALSFHGCFEGLSLGLADAKQDVWLLCLALFSHKIFIGFSIGMELLEVGISRLSYIIQICIFSAASPAGALIGLSLVHALDSSSEGLLVLTIFEGFSGGTILYVVFCEILERERGKNQNRGAKLVSLFLGFLVMAGIQGLHVSHCEDEGEHVSANQTLLVVETF